MNIDNLGLQILHQSSRLFLCWKPPVLGFFSVELRGFLSVEISFWFLLQANMELLLGPFIIHIGAQDWKIKFGTQRNWNELTIVCFQIVLINGVVWLTLKATKKLGGQKHN